MTATCATKRLSSYILIRTMFPSYRVYSGCEWQFFTSWTDRQVRRMSEFESAFRSSLRDALSEGVENGITVEGGWIVEKPDSEDTDWSVEITEVRRER